MHSAADQGLAEAQFNLGLMYAQGKGVSQNYVEAAKYRNIGEKRMTPSQIEEAQDLARGCVARNYMVRKMGSGLSVSHNLFRFTTLLLWSRLLLEFKTP